MLLLRLGWRNLWRHPRRTLLTAGAVAFGLAMLLIFLGIGDGGHEQMVEVAIRMGSGHVLVQAPEYQRRRGIELLLDAQTVDRALQWGVSRPGVEAAMPRVFCSGLLSSADGACGVFLMGIDPAKELPVSRFPSFTREGEFLEQSDERAVLLGRGVARQLKVKPGDKVVVMAQQVDSAEINSLLLRVSGIIFSGLEELDNGAALVNIGTARRLMDIGHQAHQVALVLESDRRTGETAAALASAFPNEEVLAWPQAMPELDQYVKIDNVSSYIYNCIFLLVILFTVLNTVLMSVLERKREFFLLAALGLRPASLFATVLAETWFLTLISMLVGLGLGLAGHHYFATNGLPLSWFTDQETFSTAGTVIDPVIYSRLSPIRIAQAVVAVGGVTLAIAFLPAIRAARAASRETLRT